MANATAMDALEIAEFLAGQGTGVLSLAKAGQVYAFPVSFAYHEDGQDLYFRLGYASGSQKRAYVEHAEAASFVAYDHTPEGWKSVLAEGRLESVGRSGLDTSVEEAVNRLQIPYFQVHRHPRADLTFEIVRLDAEKLSGLAEAARS